MTEEQHHHDALIETARSELERAHAAAVAMVAGDIRRGLQLALAALRDAAALPDAVPGPGEGAATQIERALAELDRGELADMAQHIEAARTELNR